MLSFNALLDSLRDFASTVKKAYNNSVLGMMYNTSERQQMIEQASNQVLRIYREEAPRGPGPEHAADYLRVRVEGERIIVNTDHEKARTLLFTVVATNAHVITGNPLTWKTPAGNRRFARVVSHPGTTPSGWHNRAAQRSNLLLQSLVAAQQTKRQ